MFLVDDEPVVLRGLEVLLDRQAHLAVCGAAKRASEALLQTQVLAPDLVVVDLSLGHGEEDGFKLIRQMRRACPKLKILVFSMRTAMTDAQAAFNAGADGYVTKEEGTEALLEGVQLVLAGKHYVSPMVAAQVPGEPTHLGPRAARHRH